MGSSRVFSDNTQIVRVTDDSVLQDIFEGGGTASAWVYLTAQTTLSRIVSKIVTNGGWVLYFSNLRLTAYVYFDGTDMKHETGNLSLNTWYYVTMTYDSSSVSNVPTFYINGAVESSSASSTPTGTYETDVGQDLAIGNTGALTGAFRGNLCYVQAWDRVLSLAEIKESMIKAGSVTENLVGYWSVLGSDSPERDLSGNGNDGVVTGAVEDPRGPPITNY